MADVLDACRSIISDSGMGFESGLPAVKAAQVKDMGSLTTRYYIRLGVKDKPGALGSIANVFGEEKISLASVRQAEENKRVVDLVFMTHEAVERNLREALKRIEKLDVVKEIGACIRVEDGI